MLFGHDEAERALLDAYKGGRIPHAWLIGGPPGIGKATLAYRLARFVLAHPDPRSPAVQKATSLAVAADNPVARRIAAQAQGDLLVLERVINEQTGKLYTVIRVDDVRRAVPFFGSTAGEGGWRIAIVDAVDDLQREGANALLKVLEEPPARSLLLLVSHAPGRAVADHPFALPASAVAAARRAPMWRARSPPRPDATPTTPRYKTRLLPPTAASRAPSACSTVRRWRCASACSTCSRSFPIPIRARCTRSAMRSAAASRKRSPPSWTWSMAGCRRSVSGGSRPARQTARTAEVWEKVNRAARDVETYNLERKPLVFAVFGLLAEAARP